MKASPFRRGKVDVYISTANQKEVGSRVRTMGWLYEEDVESKFKLDLAVHHHVYIDKNDSVHISDYWTVTEIHSGSFIVSKEESRIAAVKRASERLTAAVDRGINLNELIFREATKQGGETVVIDLTEKG